MFSTRGRVVLVSSQPEFSSPTPTISVFLPSIVPSSTSRLHLCISNWSASCQLVFLICWVYSRCLFRWSRHAPISVTRHTETPFSPKAAINIVKQCISNNSTWRFVCWQHTFSEVSVVFLLYSYLCGDSNWDDDDVDYVNSITLLMALMIAVMIHTWWKHCSFVILFPWRQTRLPVYLSHTPAGTSVKNMAHFCQVCPTEMSEQQ